MVNDGKYIVFVDYGPDNYVRFFNSYEEAKEELERMENDNGFSGTFNHYLAKIIERKTINHK